MKRFICLEGVDAVGKTSVSRLLATRLSYAYYKSPGDPFASIRAVVDNDIDPITRYFFYRSATQNDSRKISGMLENSGVVCDRYIYSTFAFHWAMDGDLEKISELTGLIKPDYVFILTASEDIRRQRLEIRGQVNDLELNLEVQNRADGLFRSFGHTIVDTSNSSVEETVDLILSKIK